MYKQISSFMFMLNLFTILHAGIRRYRLERMKNQFVESCKAFEISNPRDPILQKHKNPARFSTKSYKPLSANRKCFLKISAEIEISEEYHETADKPGTYIQEQRVDTIKIQDRTIAIWRR